MIRRLIRWLEQRRWRKACDRADKAELRAKTGCYGEPEDL